MSAVCRHQRSNGQTGGGDSSSGAIYMVKVCRNPCPVARVPVARCNDANLTNIVFLPMSEMQLFFLIYGMCLMFYLMMSWIFIRKPRTRLKKLISVLMFIILMQYVKDLFFLGDTQIADGVANDAAASLDFVAVRSIALSCSSCAVPVGLRFAVPFSSSCRSSCSRCFTSSRRWN